MTVQEILGRYDRPERWTPRMRRRSARMLAEVCRVEAHRLSADIANRRLGVDQAPDEWSLCDALYRAASLAEESPEAALRVLRIAGR